jgi:UDP-GlcNAc:undecaprenyl-phosphate/decaprenyl-phosphate GlcNAc-1-phosphate transferase
MERYALAFGAAAAVSLVATPLVIRLAKARRLYDRPGLRKVHTHPVPRIGGVAIAIALILGCLPALLMKSVTTATGASTGQLAALILLSLGMCLVGLVDDIRGLRAWTKLAFQLAAAIAACACGIRITVTGLDGFVSLQLGWWISWPLTVVWIVGVTNAINLIDGLDGLAAGIAAITCLVVGIFAATTDQTVMAVLMLAGFGSLVGFLVFNFNPARVFMGDSGTLFLGFFLATASVMCATKTQTILGLALPAMSLGLPLFDTLFSIVRRIAGRRSIFSPDRSHIHHRLIAMGIHHRQAVLLLYLVTALAGGFGATMLFLRHEGVIAVFLAICLALVLLFRVTGTVRFRESLRQIQQRLDSARSNGTRQRKFSRLQLRLHEARDLHQWWRCIRLAAREMGFVGLRVDLAPGDAGHESLLWSAFPLHDNLHHMGLTLSDQCGQGHAMRVELYLPTETSLESAGRAIALFGRLIENRDLRATSLIDEMGEPGLPGPDAPLKDASL